MSFSGRNVFRDGVATPTFDPTISSTDLSVLTNDNWLSTSVIGGIVKNPGLSTTYAQHKLAKNTALAEVHEECRAILARGAMLNVVTLTVLESQLSSMVPQATDRLKAIVNTFTYSSMQRIARW